MRILVFILFILFIGKNLLLSQDNIKWVADDEHRWYENRVIATYSYSSPIILSNESDNGISHFSNFSEIALSYDSKINSNTYLGFLFSYTTMNFANDYSKLIKAPTGSNIQKISVGGVYTISAIKGKSVFLNLSNSFSIDYLFSDYLKAGDNNGFDFSSFGAGISAGPYLGFKIIKDIDLHIGGSINFAYYNQFLFFPKVNVSISKWIN